MQPVKTHRNPAPEKEQADTLNGNPLFSFGIIADAQYSDIPPAGSRYYRSSLAKLQDAVDTFKASAPDFAVNLGDIIDMDFKSYNPAMKILESSGLRIFHVTGNHDYSVEPEYIDSLPVKSPDFGNYYSLIYRHFRLLFLDGNEISVYSSGKLSDKLYGEKYLDSLKRAGAINAVAWNGGIGKDQISWIRKEIEEAEVHSEKVLIFCHFPVYPDGTHNLLNCNEMVNTVSGYLNVIAWFSGHYHAGNYARLRQIHFLTFEGMVETPDSNSFAIVKVFTDRLEVRGFGREKSRILNLESSLRFNR